MTERDRVGWKRARRWVQGQSECRRRLRGKWNYECAFGNNRTPDTHV